MRISNRDWQDAHTHTHTHTTAATSGTGQTRLSTVPDITGRSAPCTLELVAPGTQHMCSHKVSMHALCQHACVCTLGGEGGKDSCTLISRAECLLVILPKGCGTTWTGQAPRRLGSPTDFTRLLEHTFQPISSARVMLFVSALGTALCEQDFGCVSTCMP